MASNEWSSLYNSLPEVRERLALPSAVILNDVTLREGIQASKVSFDVTRKVTLARMLDEVGLSQIQVGYPGRSQVDREAIQVIKKMGVACTLEGLCTVAGSDWQEQIQVTLESGVDMINVALPTAESRLEYVLKISKTEMLKRVEEAVALAGSTGRFVTFTPIDATRTTLALLKEVLATATDAGADRFYIVDTAGAISPQGFRYLVTEIKKVSNLPLGVHCHDDFGLATANALTAVESGAEVVDVCVNGIGKRAGNLPLEEIAVALTVFYGLELDIRLEKLYYLSQAVADMTGISLYEAKPIVGPSAFDFEVDVQLRGAVGHVLRGSVDPATVGHPGKP